MTFCAPSILIGDNGKHPSQSQNGRVQNGMAFTQLKSKIICLWTAAKHLNMRKTHSTSERYTNIRAFSTDPADGIFKFVANFGWRFCQQYKDKMLLLCSFQFSVHTFFRQFVHNSNDTEIAKNDICIWYTLQCFQRIQKFASGSPQTISSLWKNSRSWCVWIGSYSSAGRSCLH